MKSLVSIIVPVYNAEKFLNKCINSLIRQTYKKVEIILVNDGSLDTSLKICGEFKNKDERVQVYNKENEGVELARDDGYKMAKGKYVVFVDSDDYLPLDAIEVMVDRAEKEEADIVIGNMMRIIGNHGFVKRTYKSLPECVITHEEMMEKYYLSFFGVNILPVTMCAKLYRKEFLDGIQIKKTGLKHGEDLCFNMQIFPHASRTVIMDNVVYFYRWGGMTSKMNKTLFDNARKVYRYKKEMLQKFKVNRGEYYIAVELKNFLVTYVEAYIIYTQMNKKEIEAYIGSALQSEEMQDALKNLTEKEKSMEIVRLMENGNVAGLVQYIYPQAIQKKKRRKYKYLASKCLYRLL